MKELKSCPFCGGEAKASNVLMCVYCVNCGIDTECYSDNSISIKKWNTRIGDSINPQNCGETETNAQDKNINCSCGVKYVETKRTDIPYDTDNNVYYTDIMIYHCPKCGEIDRIEDY